MGRSVYDLEIENERLKQWVADLMSGTTVNCVYCGFNYGPSESTPTSMANVLHQHVATCEHHPLSKALSKIIELQEHIDKLKVGLKLSVLSQNAYISYEQNQNNATVIKKCREASSAWMKWYRENKEIIKDVR